MSIEPNQSARVSDEQLEIYQQAVARLKALEEEILVERDRATRSAQRVAQLEGQLGRVQELELMLAREREQTAQLKRQLAEADSATARVQELESALKTERERTAEMQETGIRWRKAWAGVCRNWRRLFRKNEKDSAQQAMQSSRAAEERESCPRAGGDSACRAPGCHATG